MPTATFSSVAFNVMDKSNPTTVGPGVDFGAHNEFNPQHSAILVDTSSVTGPVTVSACTITCTGLLATAGIDVALYKLLKLPNMSELTWNNYNAANAFATPGALAVGDVDSLTPVGEFINAIVGANTIVNGGAIALIQDWINNPSNNKGFLMCIDPDAWPGTNNYFQANTMSIDVTYTAGGPPPPTTSTPPADFHRHEGQRISYGLTR